MVETFIAVKEGGRAAGIRAVWLGRDDDRGAELNL